MMQLEQFYCRNYRIGPSESDFRSMYRPSAMLEHMQLAADGDLNAMGISTSEMLEQGLGWMLLATDLSILHPARLDEEVSLFTWSKGSKGVLWLRDFILTNHEGDRIAEARTSWALIDLQKRKPLRPSAMPVEVKAYPEHSLGDIPEKIILPEGRQTRETDRFTARYSSTDSNGHMNNARYADLCCDNLTPVELAAGIRRLQISYYREVHMFEQVIIERTDAADGIIWFRGMAADERGTVFEAKLQLNGAA
ncbi:acyl-[acyl-carrier-protein] thioesterase [Paenibacillus protaetiae]|uniref:Acyl-ACP thioesterase n=1 Tax=Paenibacillus protaetiae TaxID=2509456 RepID=A0A4P6ET88_9BACL|nr:acyl-ACP thioesterase domain-containing protein [Paenibacillus protaetiae]QAY65826.1 acyl-ACP thioesterase [Paenibacillus protaetiae]